MPLLKGASSEYTTFIKYNALTLPATAVRARSTISLPGISIVSTLTKASTIAARSSPRTSVLQTYEVRAVAAEEEEVATGPVYLPVSVSSDAFIVKYSRSGAVQWATRISGTGGELGFNIITDSTGVYVTGRYVSISEVTLNNGITLPITAGTTPGQDAFIVKYNTSGVAQWATRISGAGFDQGHGIATDSTGVYVTGIYTSVAEVTLNNGITLPITARASPSATPGSDGFIVKYNTSGLAQWATTIRGTGDDQGYGIATDSTGVYVTGLYRSTSEVTLNNGKTLPSTVADDAFIVKYDTSGLAQWATTIRGTEFDMFKRITADATGVYVTGNYRSTSEVTLNNGITLPSNVNEQTFIVKYDTSGLAQWATRISGLGDNQGYGIATDSTGVYVSGYYTSASEVTLNNGITLPITAGTPPGFDAFIVKYNTSGVAQWATTIRGLGGDFGYGITTDSTGVYVSGDYTSDSEVTLNNGITLPITARASPSATPGQDAFIVKYNTSGVAQWATTIRGTGGDAANSITADSTGVYAIGYYTSSDPILLTNGS